MSSTTIGASVKQAAQTGTNLITGNKNLVNEASDPFTMYDNAQIIGGDKVEALGTLTRLGAAAKIINGIEVGPEASYFQKTINGVEVGENSSFLMTSMDESTRSLLDQALTIVSTNANNLMAFAAGRDADKELADESTEIATVTDRFTVITEGIKEVLSPVRVGIVLAVIAIYFYASKGGFKKGRKRK
jgi:hypothetical protein